MQIVNLSKTISTRYVGVYPKLRQQERGVLHDLRTDSRRLLRRPEPWQPIGSRFGLGFHMNLFHVDMSVFEVYTLVCLEDVPNFVPVPRTPTPPPLQG